mgnify:FL=1
MEFKSKDSGFTLIEVITSIAVLALISIPVFGSLYSSLNSDGAAEVLTEEATIAQNTAECIKAGDIKAVHLDEHSQGPRVYIVKIQESYINNGISRYNISVSLKKNGNSPYILSFYYKPGALSESSDAE